MIDKWYSLFWKEERGELFMFLGFNEMKYLKGWYVFVVLVMVLIVWLIFILLGLVNGLV